MSVFRAYKLLHLGKTTLFKALAPIKKLCGAEENSPATASAEACYSTGTGKRSDWR